MPASQLPGVYGTMAQSINALVHSHIELKNRIVDVVTGYAEGQLDVAIERLPGQKARISEAVDKVQQTLRHASTDRPVQRPCQGSAGQRQLARPDCQ